MSEIGALGTDDDGAPEPELETPSEAFATLGNEIRTSILDTLDADEPLSFTELFEASSVDTSAGFAYHLRQLTSHYVEQGEDERYRLTYAGRRMAREIRAGTYTDRRDFDPIEIDEDCPLCGEPALVARCVNNDVTITCSACERSVLRLPFPPGSTAETPRALLASFDRHHRHRLSSMAAGTCPECAADVATDIGFESSGSTSETDDPGRPRVRLACERCGVDLSCPVTLAVLEHPAVVSFYHDHDEDLRERPIWNVGEEWAETVISTDPPRVRVTTVLAGDLLELFVGGDLSVVETRRGSIDDEC